MGKNRLLHNNLFGKVFHEIENTNDFIRGALPAGIVKKLDFSTTEIQSTSHVDDSLRSYLSDFVIKIKTKEDDDVDLYFLFEHKSYKDKDILWQLLKYQYLMLEEDFKAKRKFRIIIPVVFYHGHGKWNLKKSFSESFDVPHYFRRHTLNFEYFLYDTKDFDLSQGERFGNNPHLMSTLWFMKQYGKMNNEKFRIAVRFMKSSGMSWRDDRVYTVIRYFIMTNEVDKNEAMTIITEEFGDEAEEMMPSLGKKIYNEGKEKGILVGIEQGIEKGIEQGIEKGRQEGIEKGIQKGAYAKAVETCKKALIAGADIKFISKITGLSIEEIKEIRKNL
ncbi:MAG: Rpn family recombination-promoting nuclease/putative transposase [bacterium]